MDLETQLAVLERGQLVRRSAASDVADDKGGGYAYLFRHALTQEAAYQSLLIKTRRQIHRWVAQAYAQLDEGRPDELAVTLAHHFWEGGDWEAAAEYSTRAGTAATRVFAMREAVEHYERALEALDKIENVSPERIIDATLNWIQGAIRVRPYDELLHRLTRAERLARDLVEKRRLARVLHWLSDSHFAYGFNTRGIPALFENYQIASELGEERLTVVPSYYMALFMVDRDPRGSLTQLDHVIELAAKFHNKDIEAHAISTKAFAHARLGEFEKARAEADHAIRLARELHSPIKDADIHNLVGFAYLDMGDPQRALDYAKYGAETALTVNGLECASAGYMCVGLGNLRLRDMKGAENAFKETIRLSEFTGGESFRNFGAGGLALTRILSGSESAIHDLETAIANAHKNEDRYTEALFAESLGEVLTRSGDLARASRYLDSALEYYQRTDLRPYHARALRTYAGLYEQLGRAEQAEAARAQANNLMKPDANEG